MGRDIVKVMEGKQRKAELSSSGIMCSAGINVFHSPGWYFTFFYCLASACNKYRKWRVIYPMETGALQRTDV